MYEKKRVIYITGKDFEAFVKENSKYIADEIHAIFPKENLDPTHEDFVQHVFDVFHDYKIMTKAQREADDKKKYPKKLLFLEDTGSDEEFPEDDSGDEFTAPAEKAEKEATNEEPLDPSNFLTFDNSGFYILYYEKATSPSSLYFYLILIVCGILAYTLLPIWPLEIKIFIWWVSYIILLTIIGIIIVRYTCYFFFLIFGKEFWIFPDLFNDKVKDFLNFFRKELLIHLNLFFHTILNRLDFSQCFLDWF